MERKYKKKRGRLPLPALLLLGLLCCLPTQAAAAELVPGGQTVGIHLMTPGALVVALDKGSSPARAAGLRVGDLIVSAGGQPVKNAGELLAAVGKLDGSPLSLGVLRQGRALDFTVTPERLGEGWALGLWLRDSVSGIGTLTFLDKDTGFFGALGHPIMDVDTGEMMPLGSGELRRAEVTEVRKGQSGLPGELIGSFDPEGSCGRVLVNSACGIFGYLEDYEAGEALPVGEESDIRPGKACILSNVEGSRVERYDIEIQQVWRGDLRSLCFRVTDEALLQRTGGVVQGMSGSPILQDGKLVGAVTHVLVNDPTRGYGISIRKMLDAAQAPELAA